MHTCLLPFLHRAPYSREPYPPRSDPYASGGYGGGSGYAGGGYERGYERGYSSYDDRCGHPPSCRFAKCGVYLVLASEPSAPLTSLLFSQGCWRRGQEQEQLPCIAQLPLRATQRRSSSLINEQSDMAEAGHVGKWQRQCDSARALSKRSVGGASTQAVVVVHSIS